jgi:hypothetical protein
MPHPVRAGLLSGLTATAWRSPVEASVTFSPSYVATRSTRQVSTHARALRLLLTVVTARVQCRVDDLHRALCASGADGTGRAVCAGHRPSRGSRGLTVVVGTPLQEAAEATLKGPRSPFGGESAALHVHGSRRALGALQRPLSGRGRRRWTLATSSTSTRPSRRCRAVLRPPPLPSDCMRPKSAGLTTNHSSASSSTKTESTSSRSFIG